MKRPWPIHPALFALFPVAFLFQVNPALFTAEVMAAPAAASLAAAAALWIALSRLFANRNKAALLASATILVSFSYGVMYLGLRESAFRLGRLAVGAQGLALLASAGILGLVAWWCARTRRGLDYLTGAANVAAAVLLVISMGGAAWYTVKNRRALGERPGAVATPAAAVQARPDVYFILLDAYGRSDVLRDIYQYDNSEFLGWLRGRGFFVAESSQSAYLQTILSVASTLNFDSVQNLVGEHDGRVSDRRPLIDRIRRNRLAAHLGALGYKSVAFSTGVFATEARNADQYLTRPWFLNEFDTALLNMTPLPAVLAQLGLPELHELHRRRVLYTLEQLAALPAQPGPRFVFAHILAPHPPFVFGENGEKVNPRRPFALADGRDFTRQAGGTRPEYLEQYRAQAVFVTRRIREVIETILARSASPPVILLQSDHGPGALLDLGASLQQNPCLKERFGILNAVLLPGRDYGGFTESISPINTVRAVLNRQFGGRYAAMPEASYFSNWDQPYQFTNVSSRMACDLAPVLVSASGAR